MTNPSLSWIDQGVWARLVEDAGLRPAAKLPPPWIGRLPPAAPPPGETPPPPAAAPPADPGFQAPPGDTAGRLAALAKWVRQTTGAETVFVADEEGLPLTGPEEAMDSMAVSAEILRLMATARRSITLPAEGVLSLALDERRTLHLIECRVDGQGYGIGAVMPGELKRHLAISIRDGLKQALAQGERPHG